MEFTIFPCNQRDTSKMHLYFLWLYNPLTQKISDVYLFLLKLWKKWWKHNKIWWLGGFCMWRYWSVPGTHCMSAEGPSWPRYSDPPPHPFGGLTSCDIGSTYHTTPLHLKKLKLASDTREAVLIDSFWWFLLSGEINVHIHYRISIEKSQISLVSRIQLCFCYPWWPWKRTTDVHKRNNRVLPKWMSLNSANHDKIQK